MIKDSHGRIINYLRLAVTDRCNLRCFYCMPESGINYVNRKDLLSFEESLRIIRILGEEGVNKVRITGGEPFLRKGIMDFLESLSKMDKITDIHITTNGTFTKSYIPRLEEMGIKSINLSLDSLDRKRFHEITRRDKFREVMDTFHELLASDMTVKTNMVVMDGRNIEDIYPMLELTRNHNLSVRFIEEMPFNGSPEQGNAQFWPADKILAHIQKEYPVVRLPDPAASTSQNYQIKGFTGSFGIIAAYTRTFCGSCNRIRITPQGVLKTCLYDHGKNSLRDFMRTGKSDKQLLDFMKTIIIPRYKDGFEAEKARPNQVGVSESMATIGG